MGEVLRELQIWHRLYLVFLMGTGMALAGTAALFVRWEIGPAIRGLMGYGGRKARKRAAKSKMRTDERTELLEPDPRFRIVREQLILHSRERIGGDR